MYKTNMLTSGENIQRSKPFVLCAQKTISEDLITSTDGKLTEDSVYPDKVEFDFGMKEENPFHHIMFFSKPHNDDEKPKTKRVELADVSSFLPEKFQEKIVRFYYKTTEKPVTFVEAKWFVHSTVFVFSACMLHFV